MKKIFVLLSLAICVCVYAGMKLNTNSNSSVCVVGTNGTYDNFEKVKQVFCLEISKGDTKTTNGYYDLYKGKGNYKGYYLETGFSELNSVYKNNSSIYKGIKVSDYKYYSENKYYRFYFSF